MKESEKGSVIGISFCPTIIKEPFNRDSNELMDKGYYKTLRMRSTDSTKKLYSAWSTVKSIKVKK